jgi:hypothetical protein
MRHKTSSIAESASVDSLQVAKGPMHRRLGKLAWLLDSAIPLPGGYSIGVDALVGLIPGIGDATAALISTYIIAAGLRTGAPKTILARMVGNVAIEAAIGAIPLVGDLFDIVFKANVRNVALLDDYLDRPEKTARASKWIIIAVVLALVATIVCCIWVSLLFLGWLIGIVF